MSFSVEKMVGEPVILIQFHADFDAHTEAQKAFEASAKLLAEQTEPVFAIWDVRQSSTDLQSIMEGANVSRTNVTPANELGSIVVTNNPAVKLAMQGMNSDVYGNVIVPVFEEINEALAYIHQQLGKT
jgi:hypothetical protein